MDKPEERIRIKDIAQLAGVSVGTVDRVLHGRSGVSEKSREKVEKILKKLDYQPNMYASALASNKKYVFACLLPQHSEGEYWSYVENGMKQAIKAFSDFNISLALAYYDQYILGDFLKSGKKLLEQSPDGLIISPTIESETESFISELRTHGIPYIFIDSNIPKLNPLCFYGQHAEQSGYFAARMMSMLMQGATELVIFRQISEGRLGSNQQLHREEGFYTYMKEHRPNLNMFTVNLYAKLPDEDETILDNFFKKYPGIQYGITFNSKAYAIGEYMERHGKKDFHLMGYDLLQRNVDCLRKGSIDFIIAQQPTLQGYSSIESLCNHLILKKEIKACNYMPINLLSIENIDFYLSAHRKENH